MGLFFLRFCGMAASMFRPKERFFNVTKPKTENDWGKPTVSRPELDNNEDKKKLYGIEWAKNSNAFEAALNLFKEDTNSAVWVSLNWLSDPIVLASKELYLKTLELNTPLLDKDQFSARLLQISEEKDDETGRYTIDAKDRIAVLNLYAKVRGYIDQPDNNSSKTFNNNGIMIKVVKVEAKEEKVLDLAPQIELEPSVENALPMKLKLVS